MDNQYTKAAKMSIEAAAKAARRMKHDCIGSEHLLLGILEEENNVAAKVLEAGGIQAERIQNLIENSICATGSVAVKSPYKYTLMYNRVIEQSRAEAIWTRSEKIGTEHLLLAMIKTPDCIAMKILNSIGVNIQKLYIELRMAMGVDQATARNEYAGNTGKKKAKQATAMLDKYSRDLTKQAREGRLDPVVGRTEEIERVIQILSRRTKNNPCLVGEPGVGKTAIVEGLASMLATGNVPGTMKEKRLVSLDSNTGVNLKNGLSGSLRKWNGMAQLSYLWMSFIR